MPRARHHLRVADVPLFVDRQLKQHARWQARVARVGRVLGLDEVQSRGGDDTPGVAGLAVGSAFCANAQGATSSTATIATNCRHVRNRASIASIVMHPNPRREQVASCRRRSSGTMSQAERRTPSSRQARAASALVSRMTWVDDDRHGGVPPGRSSATLRCTGRLLPDSHAEICVAQRRVLCYSGSIVASNKKASRSRPGRTEKISVSLDGDLLLRCANALPSDSVAIFLP